MYLFSLVVGDVVVTSLDFMLLLNLTQFKWIKQITVIRNWCNIWATKLVQRIHFQKKKINLLLCLSKFNRISEFGRCNVEQRGERDQQEQCIVRVVPELSQGNDAESMESTVEQYDESIAKLQGLHQQVPGTLIEMKRKMMSD